MSIPVGILYSNNNTPSTMSPLSAPGRYIVRTTVADYRESAFFFMEEVMRIKKKIVTVSTPWYTDVTVTGENDGNIRASFQTEQPVSAGTPITGEIISPTQIVPVSGGSIRVYQEFLEPGESREISYRIEKWPVFAQLGIGMLMVAIFGILIAGRTNNPKIHKRTRRSRRHRGRSVVIRVKNAYRDTHNVTVRDWVSPLVSVDLNSFDGVKPLMRKSDAGTELLWSLGTMKAKEERLISYRVKPLVKGNLKLARAHLRFKSHKGERKKIFSNDVCMK